jgi:hypothetical protein
MTDGEKHLLKKFFDEDVPKIVAVEMERLPASYAAIVKFAVDAVLPKFIAAIDAKIDASKVGA